jgi:hypothetical protein
MRGRPSAEKRRKERARQDRKREKAQRREERRARQAERPDNTEDDPDIAGIVPGPQPPVEDMLDVGGAPRRQDDFGRGGSPSGNGNASS